MNFIEHAIHLGPDYMSRAGPVSRAGSVCRDLGTSVKHNKNQLRDYMTIGPARLAEIPASPAKRPSIKFLFRAQYPTKNINVPPSKWDIEVK